MSNGYETKDFHISDILSIATSRPLSTRHMEGVYDILNFMTRDNIGTIQIPRVMRECQLYILGAYPQFRDLDMSGINADTYQEYVSKMAKEHGEYLPVTQIPHDDHDFIDPVYEAEALVGPDKVITINPDDFDDQDDEIFGKN